MKRRRVVNAGSARSADPAVIYGVHAVGAWVDADPERLECIHYDPRAGQRVAAVLARAQQQRVPLRACPDAQLRVLAGARPHQGIVARARAFPYGDLNSMIRREPRLMLLADHFQDPQNLGALLRTAEAGGVAAVIVPRDRSAPVTAAVEAAAAGATARLPICRVTNVARTLDDLKAQGFWSAGLLPRQGVDLYHWDAPQPLILVVGGETGMGRLIARQCDHQVSIPMAGTAESLNASVAGAIAVYELLRRWWGGHLDRGAVVL
jgi:23S rRNA (guanosine2251-2'-O)-methyltransferase